jgi:hypothetical protein
VSTLYQLTGATRSGAVADAFAAAYNAAPDGRAVVRYRRFDETKTADVFLVGIGRNVTGSGTQEALIVRRPDARVALDMIPYTRLVAIEPKTQ